MIRRPPRSTPLYSSAASDVYKRQLHHRLDCRSKMSGTDGAGYKIYDRKRVYRVNCIEIKQISKKYGTVHALDQVDLRFEENKIYGLFAVSYTHLRAHET